MTETTLAFQPFFDRFSFFGLFIQFPFTVVNFKKRPEIGIHGQLIVVHGLFFGIFPAGDAGRQHVDERGAFDFERALQFPVEVVPVEGGSLRHIRHMVRGNDGGQVFTPTLAAGDDFPRRGGGGVRSHGGG